MDMLLKPQNADPRREWGGSPYGFNTQPTSLLKEPPPSRGSPGAHTGKNLIKAKRHPARSGLQLQEDPENDKGRTGEKSVFY